MRGYKGDYTVRGKDLRQLARLLNGPADIGDLYGASRTLVGWAEPLQTQQTQLPPVSVASLALPLSWETRDCGHIVTVGVSHACVGLTARWDEPVNVPADPDVAPQPYDMPSPEADALDRIEAVIQAGKYNKAQRDAMLPVFQILRETGRL